MQRRFWGVTLTASSAILLGITSSAPAAATTLTRNAYLQLSSPTNITICWRTDVPADSRVRYGPSMTNLVFTNDTPVLETNHFVTLTGLQPDTRYFYAVGTTQTNFPGGGPGTNHYFWTHPLPGSEKPIRVWVTGDAGVASNGGSVAAQPQQAVRDGFINFNGTNTLHAWLMLGDNAMSGGTDAQYQIAVFRMYSNLLSRVVCWAALGNHDADGNQTAFVDTYPFFSIFNLPTNGEAGGVPSGTEHYYSFDLGMAHFICLDSVTADRSANGPMADWLRADLAANRNRWTVAFWHYPPYTKGGYDSDARDILIEMRENFAPIVEAGGVDLVLCGHSHVYERSRLLNGHYGLSTSFDTNTMVVQPGNGRETNGAGAYVKPDGLGESPVGNRGTVYIETGCSGDYTTAGLLNHPAMVVSLRTLGSTVLDFASNRLDVTFVQTNGTISASYLIGDRFTIIKEGTHPPVISNVALSPSGGTRFTVQTRAYRTNILEAADSLTTPVNWIPVSTNAPPLPVFGFTNDDATGMSARYYRVRRP